MPRGLLFFKNTHYYISGGKTCWGTSHFVHQNPPKHITVIK